MKKLLISTLFICLIGLFDINAQSEKFQFISIYNTQPAQPFGKLGALFIKDLHPGIEWGTGKIFKKRKNHEWIWSNRVGYFYHRFVQQAVYINTDGRYRWRKGSLGIEASLGLGLLTSFPLTGVYQLSDQGEYQRKSIYMRLQASANVGLGLSWALKTKMKSTKRIFLRYEQKIQFPFIRSYVPFLPYSSIMAGCEFPIHSKSKNK